MIRILIRQTSDPRPRADKSLAIADISPLCASNPARPRLGLDAHTVAVHLVGASPRYGAIHVTFHPTVKPADDIWRFAFQAIRAFLRAPHPPGWKYPGVPGPQP